VGMETAGACFERCLGQAPAEVLMLRQLEATAVCIVARNERQRSEPPKAKAQGG